MKLLKLCKYSEVCTKIGRCHLVVRVQNLFVWMLYVVDKSFEWFVDDKPT